SMIGSRLARPLLMSIVLRTRPQSRAMHIESLPMWVGSSNNYAYLVSDVATNEAVVIYPANPAEVTPVLNERVSSGQITLTAILNTHHHWDHAGGNDKVAASFPAVPIVGGKDCPSVSRTPGDGETFSP